MKNVAFIGLVSLAVLVGSAMFGSKKNRDFRWYETSLFYDDNPEFLEKVKDYFKCHPNMIVNESNTRCVKDLIVTEMGYKAK